MIKKILLFAVFLMFIFVVKSYASRNSITQCFNHLRGQSYRTAKRYGLRAVKKHSHSFHAHLCLGEAYYKLGIYPPAINSFKKAISFTNKKNRLMIVYNWIGRIYSNIGDKKNALLYYNRSLTLERKLKNVNNESANLNNKIAVTYRKKDNYQKALYYDEKSLALARTKKDKANSYGNIGTDYFDMNNYIETIKFIKKALILDENIDNHYETGEYFLKLGSAYTYINNYSKAKNYIIKGINIEKRIGNKLMIGAGHLFLGFRYLKKGNNLNNAMISFEKAYKFFKEAGANKDASSCLNIVNKIKKKLY
ncbi:MAG: tetratricopeptide repeat protein [Candidatus Acididesulfobacter guangdongensis]|uniref:Tetratricopeptide repeat protein n=1 Tax=Acididesulfobacter guangdongensis TaxID=2597225 RepID=A0A519BFI6_ACIG2|nr:MAG: tetratricopeptide repeat protein [Candidatus Acididesulfobacter guangdongensis]